MQALSRTTAKTHADKVKMRILDPQCVLSLKSIDGCDIFQDREGCLGLILNFGIPAFMEDATRQLLAHRADGLPDLLF